ncbi:hypothetical protein M011DRAFT_373837, partial [Sporormia fimetaria CBS 119925]
VVPASTEPSDEQDSKPATTKGSLAPPPKPVTTTSTDAPDYFSQTHNTTAAFALEPNVFENSFANSSVETPGRTILPPVATITSPSPLPGITPGWQGLRSGPLSPAMLTGPQQDYFGDASYRGFPTPNESSLRTGLTPGGGGSMFPVPSPNTQAFLNLQSGVATPNTAEFQQSALRAAQAANHNKYPPTSVPTSQSSEIPTTSMSQPNAFPQSQQPPHQGLRPDAYTQHTDVSNAANDLLSFAQQNPSVRNGNQGYSIHQQLPNGSNMGHMPVQPVDTGRRNTKGSIHTVGSADTADFSESDQNEQAKSTNTRSRTRNGAAKSKQGGSSNKRKADEPRGNNRKKNNSGAAGSVNSMEDSEEETSPKPEDNKKMTDEEKRKNFLERNRVAALKCRQRKKQWLANLQNKVEMYSTENDALTATVTQLREEIVNLKTVLLAHKECPVSIAQGINGVNMNAFLGHGDQHQNPYNMAGMGANGVPMGVPMQTAQMQNR